MHCNPCGFNGAHLTFQAYLPILLSPPLHGTWCRGPRVCHRLDFRVSGPVVVATSEEAMRALKQAFESRAVHKARPRFLTYLPNPNGFAARMLACTQWANSHLSQM